MTIKEKLERLENKVIDAKTPELRSIFAKRFFLIIFNLLLFMVRKKIKELNIDKMLEKAKLDPEFNNNWITYEDGYIIFEWNFSKEKEKFEKADMKPFNFYLFCYYDSETRKIKRMKME